VSVLFRNNQCNRLAVPLAVERSVLEQFCKCQFLEKKENCITQSGYPAALSERRWTLFLLAAKLAPDICQVLRISCGSDNKLIQT
jgi:hypothetical protein